MRIMRTLIALTGLVCMWLCVAPHPTEALSIGNVAVVEQTNFCEHCVNVEQTNVALIFQDIVASNPTTPSRFDPTAATRYALSVYHAPEQERAYVPSVSDGRRRVCDSHL